MRQPRRGAWRRVHERQPSLVHDSQEADQDAFGFVEAGRFRARQAQDALAQAMDGFRAHAVRDRAHVRHREPSFVALLPRASRHIKYRLASPVCVDGPEHERAM